MKKYVSIWLKENKYFSNICLMLTKSKCLISPPPCVYTTHWPSKLHWLQRTSHAPLGVRLLVRLPFVAYFRGFNLELEGPYPETLDDVAPIQWAAVVKDLVRWNSMQN